MPVESQDVLSIWTITKNPADFPGKFVARRHVVMAGQTMVTDDHHVADDIKTLRAIFMDAGLALIPRDHNDPTVIVESWI